jgi:hypothetical protein
LAGWCCVGGEGKAWAGWGGTGGAVPKLRTLSMRTATRDPPRPGSAVAGHRALVLGLARSNGPANEERERSSSAAIHAEPSAEPPRHEAALKHACSGVRACVHVRMRARAPARAC